MNPARAINSASNLLRRKLCPGSANAERGLPEDVSAYATEGTLLHWHDANPDAPRDSLTAGQREVLVKNESARLKFVQSQLQKLKADGKDLLAGETPKVFSEREFMLCGEDMMPVSPDFPAHPDWVFYYASIQTAFIFDSKFGRVEVPQAELNMQLRTYAVVFSDEFPCERIYVAITQPWAAQPNDFHAAQYCGADMAHFRREILGIVAATEFPDAPRHASVAACAYCKARASCREAQKIVQELAVRAVNGVTVEELERMWPEAKRARDVVDQIELRLKKIARELPDALKTLKLGSTGETRKVADLAATIARLESSGLEWHEILSCCNLSLASLEELFAKRGAGMTSRAAEQAVQTILGEMIESTPKEQKLVKK